MPFLAALAASFLPALFYVWVIYRLDAYEREPLRLLTRVFLWGAVVATLGAILVQTRFEAGVAAATGSAGIANALGVSFFAPLSEELLKGLALVGVYRFARLEFDSILDGIVYGGVVGLGFAATENLLYLFGAYGEGGWSGLYDLFVLRVVMGGWNHAIYTALFGIGLAVARLSGRRGVRLLAPPLGLAAAIGAHSLHNTLTLIADTLHAGAIGLVLVFLTDWASWILMLAGIVLTLRWEGRLVERQLADEVEAGVLRADQLAEVRSLPRRQMARLRALWQGRYRARARFQQACAELAHKKNQRSRRPGESGLDAVIADLRHEIGGLAPTL